MDEPWKKLTFKQIKQLTRNKSDNYVHKALKNFVKSRILEDMRIGNVITYSIAKNEKALSVIGFLAEFKANNTKHLPNLTRILGKIKTPFYSFLITGSYAKNKQKNDSDIDIVIICDDSSDIKNILAEIKLESELNIPEVHAYVFKSKEFYEMLINKEENYGKEAARSNLIISGGKQFYKIIMEAIQNGFNG